MGVVWSCEIKKLSKIHKPGNCVCKLHHFHGSDEPFFFSVGMICELIGAKWLPRRITWTRDPHWQNTMQVMPWCPNMGRWPPKWLDHHHIQHGSDLINTCRVWLWCHLSLLVPSCSVPGSWQAQWGLLCEAPPKLQVFPRPIWHAYRFMSIWGF